MRDRIRRAEVAASGIETSLPELLGMREAAQGLRLAPVRGARAPLVGPHRSAYRGRGIDFDEVRAYQPGDDVRTIDWRVTARTGCLYSKVFHEERERPVWLLADLGASMRFGSRARFKSVAAARATALIAWVSLLEGDRVGAVVRSPTSLWERDPRPAEGPLFEILRTVVRDSRTVPDGEGPSLASALLRLRARLRAGSRVFLLSDFYALDAALERGLAEIAGRAELTCVSVYDALEAHAPPAARYRASDGSALRSFSTRGPRARELYERAFAARRERLRNLCRRHRADCVELRVDEEPVQALAHVLQARRGASQASRAA